MGPLLPLSVLVLLFGTQALAGAEYGHRTVGYIARLYFTDEGQALFNELFEPADAFDISDGAVWADSFGVQNRMPYSKPWHYIDAKNNPPTICKMNYKRDCDADRKCIVQRVETR